MTRKGIHIHYICLNSHNCVKIKLLIIEVSSLQKANFEGVIEKLRNGEIEQFEVTKEEFPQFREVLMRQKDKAQIRGEAKKGGGVVYTHVK